MHDSLLTTARDWFKQTAANIFTEQVPSVDGSEIHHSVEGYRVSSTKWSSEEMGAVISFTCLGILENNVPHLIEEVEKSLVLIGDDPATHRQKHEKFHAELSALAFVLHRVAISIFGPSDPIQKSQVLAEFDQLTDLRFSEQFLDLAKRRDASYVECLQENLGSEYLVSSLTVRLNHFCNGGENFGHEPMRGSGLFECFSRGMAARALLGTVFDVCEKVFAEGEFKKTGFDVVLEDFGNNKIGVIRVVYETGLSLKEAKDLVEGAPSKIKARLSKEDAQYLQAELEAIGASVSIA